MSALILLASLTVPAWAELPAEEDPQGPVVLDTVVISAAGYEQSLVEAPASISIITSEFLRENRITSIADALRGMQGVDVDSTVGKTGTPVISIRGMPSDYTLVLVDGRRQNVAGNITPNGFGETANAFMPPPAAIERIEVIRGPMSTLYGSDAIGGVVNIITKKVGDTWVGSMTADTTLQQEDDYGARHGANLYLSGPLLPGKLGLTLRSSYIRREASDIYATTGGTRFSINDSNFVPSWQQSRGFSPTDGDIWNFGGRLNLVAGENHDFWFDADWARQTFDNSNQGLGTLDYGPSAPTAARGYKDALRFNRDQFALGWNGRFDLGTLDTSLMYNTTETLGRTIPNGTFAPASPIQPGDDRLLTNDNLVFDAKFVAPIGDRHTATLGTQYWQAEMQDGIAADGTTGKITTFEGKQWSLFGENAWHIFSDLTLTLGLRYDNHDVVGDNLSPRAYAVWTPAPKWTIKGGVSQGFKTPGLNQFYDGINGVSGQGTVFSYGNPNLKPETSTSYELGFVYDNFHGFSASITAFHTTFDDKLGTEPNPNVPGSNWTANVDNAESYGFETFVSYDFSQDWNLSANYTWTESEYKGGVNAGQPFQNTPKHAANARLRWSATDALSLWLSGEYRGERYRGTDTRGIQTALGDYKAYELFHLGAVWKPTDRLTLNATIYNLLNKDFVDFDPYFDTTAGGTRYASAYANIYERRRLWISTTYTF